METGTTKQKITLAFINDKSPILDIIYNDLTNSGMQIVFRSESIESGLSNLYALKEPPDVCIIDLDFYDKQILEQLKNLRLEYPTIKLIAHSDIDGEKAVMPLLDIGFAGYLLIGSDTDDFKKAIEGVFSGKRYFSVGISIIAKEYLKKL